MQRPIVVDVQHTALGAALSRLFEAPSFGAAQQLAAIADAIYTATITLTAQLSSGTRISYI